MKALVMSLFLIVMVGCSPKDKEKEIINIVGNALKERTDINGSIGYYKSGVTKGIVIYKLRDIEKLEADVIDLNLKIDALARQFGGIEKIDTRYEVMRKKK